MSCPAASTFRSWEHGYVAVDDDGRIVSVGEAADAPRDGETIDLGSAALISPGFVDTHLHAPQLEMIGSVG